MSHGKNGHWECVKKNPEPAMKEPALKPNARHSRMGDGGGRSVQGQFCLCRELEAIERSVNRDMCSSPAWAT